MKKDRRTAVIIAILVAVTAIAAAVHLRTRPVSPGGTLVIEAGERTAVMALEELELTSVQGTIVNGKGEEKTVDGQGERLFSVLERAGIAGYSQVVVTADDAYSVTVSAAEIAEEDRVYLLTEDDQFRLVVFGDPDSKRNVSNVVHLAAE